MPGGLSSEFLCRRIAAVWRLKVIIALLLPIVFCVPYFLLQHLLVFPARQLPLSGLDHAVPFQPGWVWMYESFYLIINLVPWLGRTREDISRYLRGFAILAVTSFAIFIFFPVQGPRPAILPGHFMYHMVVSYDTALNAFPSLHAGLLIYTLAFGWRVAGDRLPTRVAGLILIWTGLILYSTLAIKEHYAIDLFAGAMLAVVCDALAWRLAISPPLPETPLATAVKYPSLVEDNDPLPTPDRSIRES